MRICSQLCSISNHSSSAKLSTFCPSGNGPDATFIHFCTSSLHHLLVFFKGLVELLQIAGGNIYSKDTHKENAQAPVPSVLLSERDFSFARSEAAKNVKVPMDVIDLLADLRTWLQEQCEPPVYLSDRRLVKAMGLLQVTMHRSIK